MDNFKIIDNCLMVKLPSEIDHHSASYICEMSDKMMLQDSVQHVVFDFEDTVFMDSSGIGIIMGRYQKISCFGGHVFAIHVNDRILRILKLSGVTGILEVLNG